MDYLPAFPSQVGIKGRLWQTNVFQDGSHETHLVFKVVGFKGMFELWRFSHLLSPLLIWERVEALPTPTPSSWSSSSRTVCLYQTLRACFIQTRRRSQAWVVAPFSGLNIILFFPGCLWGWLWDWRVSQMASCSELTENFPVGFYWGNCWDLSGYSVSKHWDP